MQVMFVLPVIVLIAMVGSLAGLAAQQEVGFLPHQRHKPDHTDPPLFILVRPLVTE